jgi:hypothetical protein
VNAADAKSVRAPDGGDAHGVTSRETHSGRGRELWEHVPWLLGTAELTESICFERLRHPFGVPAFAESFPQSVMTAPEAEETFTDGVRV